MTDFSKLLNPEQFAAATADDGPVLVLAAAGTGKTRTLVHRVAYLIEKGVPPGRILLLTFTNRAAREMLERAQKVVGDAAGAIWSGTFHSICARLLRRYGSTLGYQPNFRILDEDDQKKLIGDLIKTTFGEAAKDFPKKEIVLKIISEAVNEEKGVTFIASRWQTKTAGINIEAIAKIAKLYAARKLELAAMDFDDLLVNGLRLLTENERLCSLLQEHFLHVLVDEYQDTNGLQAAFTDLLAAKHRNILAVGDDFQCIYTWRGAQIANILDFPKRWPGCRTVKLERNYRSIPGILDVANTVMKDVPRQFEKMLRPARSAGGERPWRYRVYDGKEQANEILKIVNELHDFGFRYADMAVLYRSHYQSIDVQMIFARMNIPHRITSGVGVFEQVHTKDVLSYLRLLTNPRDELSFSRLICLLPGVGEKGAAKMWEKLGRQFDGKREEDRAALGGLLGAKARPVWPSLEACFKRAPEHLALSKTGALVKDFSDFFYDDHLRKEYDELDAEDRKEDVKELAVQIAEAPDGLEGFLADVALLTNLDVKNNDGNLDRVTLSTVHQAKGMEWPVVILPWLSEGMFPSAKAVEEDRMDEERRLFYVAVTRAKDKLYLFTPQMRRNPDGGMFPVNPSQFVREIPHDLLQMRIVQSYSDYGDRHYDSYGGGGRYQKAKPKTIYTTTWRH